MVYDIHGRTSRQKVNPVAVSQSNLRKQASFQKIKQKDKIKATIPEMGNENETVSRNEDELEVSLKPIPVDSNELTASKESAREGSGPPSERKVPAINVAAWFQNLFASQQEEMQDEENEADDKGDAY